jgi:hypothetical protein
MSNFARKASNTIEKINGYALPALGLASAIAPQFAPAFGSVAAGLKTASTVGKSLHDIEKNYNNKFR